LWGGKANINLRSPVFWGGNKTVTPEVGGCPAKEKKKEIPKKALKKNKKKGERGALGQRQSEKKRGCLKRLEGNVIIAKDVRLAKTKL